MRKGQTVEQQFKFMENCRKLKLLVHGCFMVGFPGETHETMRKTLNLALRLDPDSAQFYPVMPYPGTGAYQWAKDNQYLATDRFDEWVTDEGGHRCVLNLPGLPPHEIEQFCENAFTKFHFRPRYMIRKLRQAITKPREGLRSVAAALSFIAYLVTNKRRRQASFQVPVFDIPEGWRNRTRVARGRMEQMDDVLRKSDHHADPRSDLALHNAVLEAEQASQR
jgi:radical SAM superfamily enzyme YgiQ (UPF0313 family)